MPHYAVAALLQSFTSLAPDICSANSHFFESRKSRRRLELFAEINAWLCVYARQVLPMRWRFSLSRLAPMSTRAAHYHVHAVHDPDESDGDTYAVDRRDSRNQRVLAHHYMLRWNIEKNFDEVKNKLWEKKA